MSDEALESGLTDQKTAVLSPGRVPAPPEPTLLVRPDGLRPGDTLDHYDILAVLGRGGYGVVYKAFDRKLRREVAVKLLAADLPIAPVARERFVREARAAAAVRHENVVQIHAVEDGDFPYLVMEYVAGQSLSQLLAERGPLDLPQVLRLGSQVARGLAAAHQTGLVHRDVKPANILVAWDGAVPRVKLTDFGIARTADDASLTQSGAVVGTPMYMSPEQARGEPLDQRSDLFSLGSVLSEAVCGRPPFQEASGLTVLKRVAEDAPRPIRAVRPELPEWLNAVIARLQARRPEDRFQSAREVADLFDGLLAAGSRAELLVPVAPGGQRRRRRLAVAACLGLLAGLLWLASRPRPAVDPEPTASLARFTPLDPVGPQERHTNALGMQFVRVPAGAARLGGGAGQPGALPVAFKADFYLGLHEVTVGEWERVLGPGTHPARFSRAGEFRTQVAALADDDLRRLPVEGVSWDDCQTFLRELNRQAPEVGWSYRLPRSDEWEYACRGGPGLSAADLAADVYAGAPATAADPARLNFRDSGRGRPEVVGSFPPNRLGLCDMHGNVFELLDAGDGDLRWFAGGCWHSPASHARAAVRLTVHRTHRISGMGLRVARVVTGPVDPLAATAEADVIAADLRQRNPLFKGEVRVRAEDGRIREIWIDKLSDLTDVSALRRHDGLERLFAPAAQVADLSPLRGLPLRHLDLNGNTALTDLTPLKGMPLEHLSIWGFQGDDLAPLADMPLKYLNCGGGGKKLELGPLRGLPLSVLVLNHTRAHDLAPLKGLPLIDLGLNHTQVSDLAPLRAMKTLRKLHIEGAPVAGLAPLRGLMLEAVEVTFDRDRDADVLRGLATLREINQKPAAEFWMGVARR